MSERIPKLLLLDIVESAGKNLILPHWAKQSAVS